MRTKIVPALALLVTALPASAASVFSDGFEGDGPPALSFSAFDNFTVTRGSVDLLANGSFGLPCRSGNRCLDMAGSAGVNGATSTDGQISSGSFSFAAGDTVTLSFYLAGSQRGTSDPVDDFGARFDFAGVADLASYGRNFGSGDLVLPGLSLGAFSFGQTVFADEPYTLRSMFFTANSAGSFTFDIFSTDSGDDFGPLLDDINLDITAGQTGAPVPEPATWAMMLLGFGLAGAAIRRADTGRLRTA